MESEKVRYLHHKIDNMKSASMSTISGDRVQDALVPGEVKRMSESIDATKKEFADSHGNDSERSAPNFRYQTIYPGQWYVSKDIELSSIFAYFTRTIFYRVL